MIDFDNFQQFCKKFDIENIINSKFFAEAMTHASVSRKKNYERLEFFGDTILNFCVSKMLFEEFSDILENELSEKKCFLVSREICYRIAKDIYLDGQIICDDKGSRNAHSILAGALEALIAVIYLEFGEGKIFEIIKFLFLRYLDDFLRDSKMELQEFTQKKFGCLPIYKIVEKIGEEHNLLFKISVSVKNFEFFAEANNKKLAEKKAAAIMLMYFKE